MLATEDFESRRPEFETLSATWAVLDVSRTSTTGLPKIVREHAHQCLQKMVAGPRRRQDQDWKLGKVHGFANESADLDPGHVRHVKVHDQKIRRRPRGESSNMEAPFT